MDENKFSCIKEVTKTVRLTLPTAWESNELSGVSDTLENWKRQYIQQLQAVVVGYKNVSLISVLGYSKYECPFIRCDVNATFELFYPTVGSIVKGKINRVSHDHIGCLVHNTINVTIDQPSDTSDISSFITLDRYILFQITRLNSKRKIVSVKGNITPECIKLMIESGQFKSEIGANDNISIYSSPKSDVSNKSKKLKWSSLENTDSSIAGSQNPSSDDSSDMSCHIPSSIKKKKHKKSKSVSLSSPPLFCESLESDVNEIEPTQVPEITTRKNRKSKTEARTQENVNNCDVSSTVYVKNEVHTDSASSHASPKKSFKKNPETLKSSPNKGSPKKKHKKSKSETSSEEFLKHLNNVDFPFKVEENIQTDLQSSSIKSKKSSNNISKNFTDVYEMMEALSSFEPPPEAQLLSNEFSQSTIKEKETSTKKRKRDSSGASNLPKKKRKMNDESVSNKSHEKKKKSKKDSKKDKKKKSKDKVISTKKKLHGYKVKLKKGKKKREKSETKRENKSVKQKTKNVPLLDPIKSEEN